MRTFVIGDIHGAHKALVQCLERSNFDKENDLLITLGDIADGWSEVVETIEELLTIKNRIDIRGNHDEWAYEYLTVGATPLIWTSQGGRATIESFKRASVEQLEKCNAFFRGQHYYYLDDKKRLFVHGGVSWNTPLEEQHKQGMTWDRHMYNVASYWELQVRRGTQEGNLFKDYFEVYIGHSATPFNFNSGLGPSYEPCRVSNLWNLDQGAGWGGKLSIMDIDTKEFWQSDLVEELYPEEKGRRG